MIGDFKIWLRKTNYDIYLEDWGRFVGLDKRVDGRQISRRLGVVFKIRLYTRCFLKCCIFRTMGMNDMSF